MLFKRREGCIADLVVCIGGDGTVLRMLCLLNGNPIPPIVTISMGSLNYLGNFVMSDANRVF